MKLGLLITENSEFRAFGGATEVQCEVFAPSMRESFKHWCGNSDRWAEKQCKGKQPNQRKDDAVVGVTREHLFKRDACALAS